MEKSFPTLVKILNSEPVSVSPQLLYQRESGSKSASVDNVNHDVRVVKKSKIKVKKSKKNHVQRCAGGNCSNNRIDNPGQ